MKDLSTISTTLSVQVYDPIQNAEQCGLDKDIIFATMCRLIPHLLLKYSAKKPGIIRASQHMKEVAKFDAEMQELVNRYSDRWELILKGETQ